MTSTLHFKEPPFMPGLLLRAALNRKPAELGEVPQITARLEQLRVDRQKLARYNSVCGFDSNSEYLPATYPHIAAFSLHMEMLLNDSFPFAPMGIVHTANRITQQRPIHHSEQLALDCSIADSRTTDIGLEVDIFTEAKAGAETVWTELTTVLKRGKPKPGKRTRNRPELPDYAEKESWSLPANLGRRYARVSGDYNPIHLFPASAKLLGFNRHIAHGMWSKARCLAALQDRLDSERFTIDVDFKTPLYLPANVALHFQESETGLDFSLRNAPGNRPHLNGSLTRD